MGELEEKENAPGTEATAQQEGADEPKETDKMLEKKDDDDETEVLVLNPTTSKPNSPLATEKKSVSGGGSSSVGGNAANEPPQTTNSGAGAVEEIIDIPAEAGQSDEKAEPDEKKISKEEREVKPKKIPIGGLKLPGFFMKSKPKSDGDGADGELLEREHKDEAADSVELKPKKDKDDKEKDKDRDKEKEKEKEKVHKNFGERLRNFFARKPATDKQQSGKIAANGTDADAKSEATAEASPPDGGAESHGADAPPPPKRGLLNAIKLPIANMIPRRKVDEDVELGMGKAGLASMETLDDSLKDQDCVDKAPSKNNGAGNVSPAAAATAAAAAAADDEAASKLKKAQSGDIKQVSPDEKVGEEQEAPVSFAQRLRSYRCSVDDALIALGILLFVLLVGVIGYVLSHDTLTSPPIREGRYIDAVTGCGMVEGLKEDGAFAFRGIPFALPPIGEHRWRPAELIENIDDCWNGTLRAHNSSELCSQMLGNGTIIGDEDCLYLDVVTPHVRYDNPLPVIVLIGADTLTGPSPGLLRPSARYSRSHDVIFVRPNFRLGAFGFLALDALTKDAYPHTSGNYALSDILAALKWIQLNIKHFGGDPKSVTLWGHRAGATLVTALVTSKKAQELYTRAWVSSSSAIFPGKPLEESEKRNQELMVALDCQDVNCLRSASTEQIWSATPDTWLHIPADIPSNMENTTAHHEWLVLDGVILQQHPVDTMKEQEAGAMKLVMGTTAHEAHTEKLRSRHTNWTAEEVRTFLDASKIGALNLTEEAIRRYNATNYRGLVSLITDIRTICPLLTIARQQSSVPFYVVTQGEGDDQLATVDADVQAILGRYEPHTVEQRRFVSSMHQLFYYYVSHGTMPQYDPHRRVLNIGQDPLPQEDYANCNFWISNDIVPRYARVD